MLDISLLDSSSVTENGENAETAQMGPGFYIPLIIIGAILILLVVIMIIAKRKGNEPMPNQLVLKMPKATLAVSSVFVVAFVIGTFLAWFLLPKDMEYRLLSQILVTVVTAIMVVILPLSARVRLSVEGNELSYRPMIGKERIYSFKDIKYIVIKAAGFDGNAYKYYDKDGKKLFSFASTTPYADAFFEKVKATNKKVVINDKRIVGPMVKN